MPTPKPNEPIPISEPDVIRPPTPIEIPEPDVPAGLPEPGPDVVPPPPPQEIPPGRPQEVPPTGAPNLDAWDSIRLELKHGSRRPCVGARRGHE